MTPDRLFGHFDRLAEAPDAIPRLRRFILDLAVRGKLVEQDQKDEPVSELLKCIGAEWEQVTEKDDITKLHARPPIPGDEGWFQVPDGWNWVSLGPITRVVMGQSPPGQTYNTAGEGIPLINGPVEFTNGPFGKTVVNQYTTAPTNTCEEGDLLLCVRGSTTGRTNIAGFRACIGRGVAAIQPLFPDRYVRLCIWRLRETIVEMGRGIAFPSVSRKQIEELPIPLPPLSEQHRIVAKVDELMALCDRLEAAQAERERRRDRLAAASLHRLNHSADAHAFREHARFHLHHLPRLTTRPDHIQLFRQTILNLAVRGQLVEQDPKDEPAAALLTKKLRLPEGHQRRRKILKKAPVIPAESLFPGIPTSWAYADIQTLYNLNAIVDYADGNHGSLYPRSSEFGDSGINFVTAKDLIRGRVSWSTCAKLQEERAHQLTKGWAQGGDVLLTHNATVGRVARVEPNAERFLLGTSVTFYRLNSEVLDPDFFYYMLTSRLWQGQLEAIMEQTTRNQVSIQKQAFFRVVVPPLAEQHRIVTKVDELTALCDRLEAQLIISESESRRLLEAILHEALLERSGQGGGVGQHAAAEVGDQLAPERVRGIR